jgi:hypothetical protein
VARRYELRKARYKWARENGAAPQVAARASCSAASLMAAFPVAEIPAGLIARGRLGGPWLIGPRTPEQDARTTRYRELRACGADPHQASAGASSDLAQARMKRELKGSVFR